MRLKELLKDKELTPLILIATYILVIRIIFIGIMGPMPQDAYYYFYSQYPALSYFDHPPAIAYLLKAFTTIFGKNVFAIKLADSAVTLLTLFFFYKLSSCFHEKKEALKTFLLFLSTLMVTILSLVSTPDTPLLLFWTLSILLLEKAIFQEKRSYWILAGLCMGMAFDSKYTAIFLPAGMLLFLLCSPAHRKYLTTIWPWLACLIFLITISGVIFWNYENHFASFKFQSAERMHSVPEFKLQPKYFLGLIGHQSALLMPVIFIAILYGLYATAIKYRPKWGEGLSDKKLFLLCFFLPLFFLFFSLSLVYWIKVNWMMPAYITGIVWVSAFIGQKWLKWQLILSGIIHTLLAIEIIFYLFPVHSDDTWMGWKDLASQVTQIEKQHPGVFIFSADSYKTSAELNLYSDHFIYSQNVIGENALQFDFIGTDLALLRGKDAIFIDSEPEFKTDVRKNMVPPKILSYFKSVKELEPVLVKKNGHTVRKFLIYLCFDYKALLQLSLSNHKPHVGILDQHSNEIRHHEYSYKEKQLDKKHP